MWEQITNNHILIKNQDESFFHFTKKLTFCVFFSDKLLFLQNHLLDMLRDDHDRWALETDAWRGGVGDRGEDNSCKAGDLLHLDSCLDSWLLPKNTSIFCYQSCSWFVNFNEFGLY